MLVNITECNYAGEINGDASECQGSKERGATHGEELGSGLVAVHGYGGGFVEGAEHLSTEGVPAQGGELLRHARLAAAACVLPIEPGGPRENVCVCVCVCISLYVL